MFYIGKLENIEAKTTQYNGIKVNTVIEKRYCNNGENTILGEEHYKSVEVVLNYENIHGNLAECHVKLINILEDGQITDRWQTTSDEEYVLRAIRENNLEADITKEPSFMDGLEMMKNLTNEFVVVAEKFVANIKEAQDGK